jgi:hypothetical protein
MVAMKVEWKVECLAETMVDHLAVLLAGQKVVMMAWLRASWRVE